ncbi:MAG: hypothetical protein COB66_03020 [Coxiella sp. (in: Bacteria)]|nr:MAG: hypothetical protein COB66_03020 [Coxiella sp. (in: g-proteobacteria)]
MSTTTPNISIIIVGYRSQHTLPACLESIALQTDCTAEVIYVENAPDHPGISTVNAHYPNAIIVEPGDNLGYGKGCNAGAHVARGDYLLFLNPDTELKGADTLATLCQFMQAHPDVGVCTPLLYNENNTQADNTLRYDYFGHRYVGHLFKHLPGDIAWICGAAMVIPKSLFEQISGFDERYFMYSDDVDICLDVRKAGYTIAEAPTAAIMHIGGESSKNWNSAELFYRIELSKIIFTQKHYNKQQHDYIWKRCRSRYRRALITSALLYPRKLSHYRGMLRAIRHASTR